MHAANISGSESMIAVIETCQLFEHAHLFVPFKLIHLSLAGDAEQVLQHAVARTRLKLALVKISSVVAILGLQCLPSRSSLQEQLAQNTSAPRFLEARAGEGDEQSSLFGLSDLFGSSGGASDPANQKNEIDNIDRTDHPPSLRKNKQAWENGMGSLVKGVTCAVEQ